MKFFLSSKIKSIYTYSISSIVSVLLKLFASESIMVITKNKISSTHWIDSTHHMYHYSKTSIHMKSNT